MERKKIKNSTYKRTEVQKAHDRAFCSSLLLTGYTYEQITERLNEHLKKIGAGYTISRNQIYKEMKSLMIRWKREHLENIGLYIHVELAKLDRIEVELWNAWELSKQGISRKKIKKPDELNYNDWNKGGTKPEDLGIDKNLKGDAEITIQSSSGNPRFLELILTIQQRRAKLLGLEAPTRIELTEQREESKASYNINALPDKLLFEMADKLQEASYVEIIEEKVEDG